MKEILLSGVLAAALAAAISLQSGTAYAADANEEVALCTEALDAQGLAGADDYRAKFEGRRGGRVTRVTLRLIPNEDAAESLVAECEIRRGEVVSATVKA